MAKSKRAAKGAKKRAAAVKGRSAKRVARTAKKRAAAKSTARKATSQRTTATITKKTGKSTKAAAAKGQKQSASQVKAERTTVAKKPGGAVAAKTATAPSSSDTSKRPRGDSAATVTARGGKSGAAAPTKRRSARATESSADAARKPAVAAGAKKAASTPSTARATVVRAAARSVKTSGSGRRRPEAAGRHVRTPAEAAEALAPEGSATDALPDAAPDKAAKPGDKASARPPEPAAPRIINGLRLVDASAKMPKSRLTPKRLAQFRAVLLERRAQLTDDVQRLSDEAYRGNSHGSDRSNMPIHMADLGTDNWEQEFDLILLDNERALVRDIDDALRRIDEGTYGICEATHRPITIDRLLAKPWARYCIEYARMREQGRVP